MLLIQVLTAALLVVGSALILKALVEIDAPERPRPVRRPRLDPLPSERQDRLPRAA
jgi:hypothetical protein